MSRASKEYGFTIVELMVTLIVAAILASVALPSFQNISRSNAVRATTNELISTINTARQQSLSLRSEVQVVPAGGGWGAGWRINFADAGAGDSAAFTVRNGVVVDKTGGGDLVFRERGGLGSGAGSVFTVSHTESASICRAFSVNFFGKVTLEECP